MSLICTHFYPLYGIICMYTMQNVNWHFPQQNYVKNNMLLDGFSHKQNKVFSGTIKSLK